MQRTSDRLAAPRKGDRLSHSSSHQSIGSAESNESRTKKAHRDMVGYEICRHTCVASPCISPKTKTILWHREGHTLWRHVCSEVMHPQCGQDIRIDCPARECIGQKRSKVGARTATDDEVVLHLDLGADTPKVEVPQEEIVEEMREVPTIDFSPPIAPHATDIGASHMSVDRSFKLIYIPDAAMRIFSKERAQNDLAFMPAVISEDEYEPLKHLTGSIHVTNKCRIKNTRDVRYRVIMQEWVSAIEYRCFASWPNQ